MPPTRYKALYEIARGGMGRVELVVDQRLHFERLHARKRLHDNFVDDTDVRAMFLDEARIAGFIRHPHVVSVTDVGEDEDGPFIVMDFVDGIALSTMVSRLVAAQVTLPLSVALSLLAQAAEGLHAAHEATDSTGHRLGVVHRDVSPQNILVGFDGHARVADFGIAKAMGRSSTRTETGVLKGKLGYSSPEVLRFEEADVRSDLFSFGVCLYEAVTMRRLYPSSGGGPRAILNNPTPDLGDVVEDAPDELVELAFSLLAKDPAHRPSTAGEVAVRLRGILRDLPFDDVMSVTDFLEEHFAEERTGQRRRIESARSEVRRSEVLEASLSDEVVPQKRLFPLRLLVFPALLLIVLSAGYMWTDGDVPGDTSTSAAIEPAVPPVPAEVPVAPEPTEVRPASREEPALGLSEAEPPAEDTSDSMDRSPRRRRPSMGMGMARARQSDVPIWDEY